MPLRAHIAAATLLATAACSAAPPKPTAGPAPNAKPSAAPTATTAEAPPPPKQATCELPRGTPEAKACLTHEKPSRCVVGLARKHLRAGEEQQATDALAFFIRERPQLRTPYLELSLLLQTNNRYDLASQVLQQALRFVPEEHHFLLHYLLGSTHAAQKAFEKSVVSLEKAHALRPDDHDVAMNLALGYTKLQPRKEVEAKRLVEPFVSGPCASGSPPPLCGLAQLTLARVNGEAPWPPIRKAVIEASPYPSPTCLPLVEEGKPTLPPTVLAKDPVRKDSAFTVWGATHHLRSKPHRKAVTAGPISVTGFIVAVNYAQAPLCAIHRAGKPTPEDCDAPTPTFYLADTLENPTSFLPVMGWASTWSSAYESTLAAGTEPYTDLFSGKPVPKPLPAVGAQVTVTGKLGFSFTATDQPSSNPRFGILTYDDQTVVKAAPKPAGWPSLKP